MYIKSRKLRTAQVAEQTFLLCKPDAQHHHRYILQTVSDAGFHVLAKSFVITPEHAEKIASMFQSVRDSKLMSQRMEGVFSPKTRLGGEYSPLVDAPSSPGVDHFAAASGDHGRVDSFRVRGVSPDAEPERRQAERHKIIMAEIMLLTSRHGETGGGVNAGLTEPEDANEIDRSESPRKEDCLPLSTVEQRAMGSVASSNNAIRGYDNLDNRVTTAVMLRNNRLKAMPYKDLMHEHVQHLAYGGTCLAVKLSGQNAVERLMELVGPEDPIDARRAAPNSIRARLGEDLIRNAVHAAANLAEAAECISTIFGFSTDYAVADVRAQAAAPKKFRYGGNTARETFGDNAAVTAVRPQCELIFPPLRSLTHGPLTVGTTLNIQNANPEAHLSFYMGEESHVDTEAHKRAESAARRFEENRSGGLRQKAEDLEQQLAHKQTELMNSAKILRTRELDLLLREHALEGATQGLLLPAGPLRQQQAQQAPMRGRFCSRSVSVISVEGGHVTTQNFFPAFFPSRSAAGLEAGRDLTLKGRTSPQQSQRSQPLANNGQLLSGVPPVIEASEVSMLLTVPARLRALFLVLEHNSAIGRVMWEDMKGLYDRSPAIQLLWLDNHRDVFTRYLENNTEEPLSFDRFVAALMFLLKQ
ncbi:putative Nucleoside diphosphate kinase [Trypanosoma vivax]|uniref:Nucleoside diphosphate kinase-like domain-containing protein n=1 Tax=Trypanosoma vivax (strain Y486) TaxID=1055687 RepID=G0U136_TRYVY|nr:hypothetical protein TRVL_07529 [Trypanosoma vivax]KAH8607917.1 putative Nucleoside diphosphate kinase [Trypanosoma vivax]CCC49791.1 conserved hypothetical protein [Trypanosoma vivax Y486]